MVATAELAATAKYEAAEKAPTTTRVLAVQATAAVKGQGMAEAISAVNPAAPLTSTKCVPF